MENYHTEHYTIVLIRESTQNCWLGGRGIHTTTSYLRWATDRR
jgi:hypothetical protein